jgi:type I restriction enzyme S subunit
MVNPSFLRYLLNSPLVQQHLHGHRDGSVAERLNMSTIRALPICFPSLAEQLKIAEVLRCLDDRIEITRKSNVTLESIIQAFFKSWFVDFDPVRAKAEGREPEGMDAATAALFPSEFEESELGLIPRGWRIDEVGNTVRCIGGATPSTKEPKYWNPAEHRWATPKDLSGMPSHALLATEKGVSDAGLKKISSGLLPAGTLLLSSRAPIGYLAVAYLPVAINQGFIAMLPGGVLPPEYLLFWTELNMETIKQKANGSTFMEISKAAFRPIKLVVPPQPVVDAFLAVAKPMLDRVALNADHACVLSDVRDALLPRLISGKLRVPEAERELAAVLA